MLQVVVYVNGLSFKSKIAEGSVEQVTNQLYESISVSNRYKMQLEDDSYLILAEAALKNAVIKVEIKTKE